MIERIDDIQPEPVTEPTKSDPIDAKGVGMGMAECNCSCAVKSEFNGTLNAIYADING